MITGYPLNMHKNVIWNTGPAAMRARFNLKLKLKNKKKKKAPSFKHQASSIKRHGTNTIKRYK